MPVSSQGAVATMAAALVYWGSVRVGCGGGATADRRGRLPGPAAGRGGRREGSRRARRHPHRGSPRGDRGGWRGVLDRRPQPPRHAARGAGRSRDRLLAAGRRHRPRGATAGVAQRPPARLHGERDRLHCARPALRGRRVLNARRRPGRGGADRAGDRPPQLRSRWPSCTPILPTLPCWLEQARGALSSMLAA